MLVLPEPLKQTKQRALSFERVVQIAQAEGVENDVNAGLEILVLLISDSNAYNASFAHRAHLATGFAPNVPLIRLYHPIPYRELLQMNWRMCFKNKQTWW